MALWEYKIISSGKGGFANPALLESHLNQLGKDEWEIIAFNSSPENPLAFQGLARRPTQRDWTLQDAAAAAAKAEAEKLRAEFAAKFQEAQTTQAALAEEKPASLVGEVAGSDGGFRRLRDTDRDQDPEALADAEEPDEWDKLDSEDELPTFFDYIRPLMRRNQRGPGMSLAVDYLANKIDQSPADIVVALKECGFDIPEREDDDPVYLEYDGDLYWVNTNRHRQLFINTKEKPRAVFRAVKGQAVPSAPKPEAEEPAATAEVSAPERRLSRREQQAAAAAAAAAAGPDSGSAVDADGATAPVESPGADSTSPAAAPTAGAPLPVGDVLLVKLRPLMRRNRRGPGISGSISFLARALKQSDEQLSAALSTLGLNIPANQNDKPVPTEIAGWLYWMNKDSRGGIWINGREKRDRDDAPGRDSGASEGENKDGATPAPGAAPALAAAETLTLAPDATATVPATANPDTAQPTPPDLTAAETRTATSAGDGSPSIPSADAGSSTPSYTAPAAPAPLPQAELPLAVTPDAEAETEPDGVPLDEEDESAVSTDGRGAVDAADPATAPLAAIRLLMKPKPRGTGASGEVGFLANALEKSVEDLISVLTQTGLRVPSGGDEKPAFVRLGDEILWLNKSEKDGSLWLNAKARPSRRPRSGAGSRRGPRRNAGESSAGASETPPPSAESAGGDA